MSGSKFRYKLTSGDVVERDTEISLSARRRELVARGTQGVVDAAKKELFDGWKVCVSKDLILQVYDGKDVSAELAEALGLDLEAKSKLIAEFVHYLLEQRAILLERYRQRLSPELVGRTRAGEDTSAELAAVLQLDQRRFARRIRDLVSFLRVNPQATID